ncbi:MAG: hypothetical protein IJB29_03670 [Mailhella sp.]|nr:hypothetical protein [Mailhella sp.]
MGNSLQKLCTMAIWRKKDRQKALGLANAFFLTPSSLSAALGGVSCPGWTWLFSEEGPYFSFKAQQNFCVREEKGF